MRVDKRLLWLGAAVYAVAWFLPVIKDGPTLAQGELPGWIAFRVAVAPVWPVEGVHNDSVFEAVLSTASGLTNLLVPLSLVALVGPQAANRGRKLCLALLFAAAVNSSWFVLSDNRGELRIGYYVWFAAFLILAVAAFRAFRSAARVPAENSA